MAQEAGASIIFTSEDSDKTRGSIREMRRATEMMILARDRPYAKDLGIDLLVLKEKRRWRESPLEYETAISAQKMQMRSPTMRKAISVLALRTLIVAVINGNAIKGRRWQDVL